MRPDFATKQFYLLGEHVSTAREIDVPSTIDEDELRQLIASNFAIVGAKGARIQTRQLDVWSSGCYKFLCLGTDCRRQELGL